MVRGMLRDPWRTIGALGLLTLAAPCQQLGDRPTPETRRAEIQGAIARMTADGFDHDALLAVIEAREDAVDPLLEAMGSAVREARGEAARRIGRALQAIGTPAARQNRRLLGILHESTRADPKKWNPALDAVVATLAELAWLAPELLGEFRESFDDLDDPVMLAFRERRFDKNLLRLGFRVTIAPDPDEPNLPVARLDAETLFERELAADWMVHRTDPAVAELIAAIRAESQPTTCMMRFTWGVMAMGESREGARRVVRDAAARALARIDPDHPEAALGLALLAADAPDPRERLRAMVALGQRGDALADETDVREVIHRILGDRSDQRLLAETITACGALGIDSQEIRARLRQLAADPKPELAARARSVLARLPGRRPI